METVRTLHDKRRGKREREYAALSTLWRKMLMAPFIPDRLDMASCPVFHAIEAEVRGDMRTLRRTLARKS